MQRAAAAALGDCWEGAGAAAAACPAVPCIMYSPTHATTTNTLCLAPACSGPEVLTKLPTLLSLPRQHACFHFTHVGRPPAPSPRPQTPRTAPHHPPPPAALPSLQMGSCWRPCASQPPPPLAGRPLWWASACWCWPLRCCGCTSRARAAACAGWAPAGRGPARDGLLWPQQRRGSRCSCAGWGRTRKGCRWGRPLWRATRRWEESAADSARTWLPGQHHVLYAENKAPETTPPGMVGWARRSWPTAGRRRPWLFHAAGTTL